MSTDDELKLDPQCGTFQLGDGYILTWHIEEQTGGRVYVSDEIGGGVVVWDTALVSERAMLGALMLERVFDIIVARKR